MRNLSPEECKPWLDALKKLLGDQFTVERFMPICDEHLPGYALGFIVGYGDREKDVVTYLGKPTMDRIDVSLWVHDAAPQIKKAFGITPARRNA